MYTTAITILKTNMKDEPFNYNVIYPVTYEHIRHNMKQLSQMTI